MANLNIGRDTVQWGWCHWRMHFSKKLHLNLFKAVNFCSLQLTEIVALALTFLRLYNEDFCAIIVVQNY